MLITPSSLDALFTSFSLQFQQVYMSTPAPLLEQIGQRVPSNTLDQRYPFPQSTTGAMREWVGERQTQNVVLDGFVVTNKKWENTIAIPRTAIEFDQYNAYANMQIPNLARHAKLLPDQQIAAAITANAVGFDNVAFFSASHPVDPSGARSGVQSNTLTGKPLNATNLALVQAAMMAYVGPDGLPLGSMGDTLIVPPSLKYTADTLANATFYPGMQNGASGSGYTASQSNVFQGQYKVVATPWIADSGDPATAVWYLADSSNPSYRFCFWQEFSAPQIVSITDPQNPLVFMQDNYYYGSRAIGAPALSIWWKCIKVSGA